MQFIKTEPITQSATYTSEQIPVKEDIKYKFTAVHDSQKEVQVFDEESYHDTSIMPSSQEEVEESKETDYEVLDENCSEYEIQSLQSEEEQQTNETDKSVTIHSIAPSSKRLFLDENSVKSIQNYTTSPMTEVVTTPPDHLEIFGRYVTGELKNISEDPYSVQVAKHKINQILFEASTGEFKKKRYQ